MKLPESFIVPPDYIRNRFTETIWETTDGSLLFTFDDGPFPESTEVILEWLETKGIHALFFVNGTGDREWMKEIVQGGHTLGNHLFNHRRALFMNGKEIEDSLLRTNQIIEDISGKGCEYFRPPYGIPFAGMGSMMKKTGMKIMMWSLLSWDFRYDTKNVCEIINRYISAGKIIVFHNNLQTVSKIIPILEYTSLQMEKRGLRCR